jgi:ubiquinone/menaquinone biosynthesis C-methylase UbiE
LLIGADGSFEQDFGLAGEIKMGEELRVNAERFTGFADLYDDARPKPPEKVVEIILRYLGQRPCAVVDLGCGTGLSTLIWSGISKEVIGIDPSTDMLNIAKEKAAGLDNIRFIQAFSDKTGLADESADVVTCSQSFHWMNPETTINEVARILKDGGVFAVYDCDWPPVINWEAEKEYDALFCKVREFEETNPALKGNFRSWPKDRHLANMKNSGKFRYLREVVFSSSEECDATRFINIALSQGGLQSIIKTGISEFAPYIEEFKERVAAILGNKKYTIDFCYRMRIGVK